MSHQQLWLFPFFWSYPDKRRNHNTPRNLFPPSFCLCHIMCLSWVVRPYVWWAEGPQAAGLKRRRLRRGAFRRVRSAALQKGSQVEREAGPGGVCRACRRPQPEPDHRSPIISSRRSRSRRLESVCVCGGVSASLWGMVENRCTSERWGGGARGGSRQAGEEPSGMREHTLREGLIGLCWEGVGGPICQTT